jgi:hypothetical protein
MDEPTQQQKPLNDLSRSLTPFDPNVGATPREPRTCSPSASRAAAIHPNSGSAGLRR